MSKLIEDFYSQSGLQDKLTLEEMGDICKSPFLFLKEKMSSGELRDIRFQYFGVFSVPAYKVKWSRKKLEEKYEDGLMSQKKYEQRSQTLRNYEERNKIKY